MWTSLPYRQLKYGENPMKPDDFPITAFGGGLFFLLAAGRDRIGEVNQAEDQDQSITANASRHRNTKAMAGCSRGSREPTARSLGALFPTTTIKRFKRH